jgi:hypothetical protein
MPLSLDYNYTVHIALIIPAEKKKIAGRRSFLSTDFPVFSEKEYEHIRQLYLSLALDR